MMYAKIFGGVMLTVLASVSLISASMWVTDFVLRIRKGM